MKKVYISPQIQVVEVDASVVMVNSYGEIPVGGTAPKADAPMRRSSDWSEYEQ